MVEPLNLTTCMFHFECVYDVQCRLVENGDVLLNGVKTTPDAILKNGDAIDVHFTSYEFPVAYSHLISYLYIYMHTQGIRWHLTLNG
jgi:hypothetical protein